MWIFNVDYIAVFLVIDSTLSFKCSTASHMTSFCLSYWWPVHRSTTCNKFERVFCQERFEMRIG